MYLASCCPSSGRINNPIFVALLPVVLPVLLAFCVTASRIRQHLRLAMCVRASVRCAALGGLVARQSAALELCVSPTPGGPACHLEGQWRAFASARPPPNRASFGCSIRSGLLIGRSRVQSGRPIGGAKALESSRANGAALLRRGGARFSSTRFGVRRRCVVPSGGA